LIIFHYLKWPNLITLLIQKNNILDYVISNNNSIKVFSSEIPIVDVDSYHPPLEINCETLNYNVDSIYTNEIK